MVRHPYVCGFFFTYLKPTKVLKHTYMNIVENDFDYYWEIDMKVNKKQHKGYCSICGKYTKLSFEHIPPEDAFNNQRAKMYSGDEIVKIIKDEQARYIQQQRGMGKYSLCEKCNNDTGSWYAPAYNLMTKATAWALQNRDSLEHGDVLAFSTRAFEPLAFVKQVITMFCSTIPLEQVQRLGFDKYILEKENNDIEYSLFDLRIYLLDPETAPFMTGPCTLLLGDISKNEFETVSVAEIGVYPFGFILNFNPEHPINYGTSLTKLLGTEYGKEYDFTWELMRLEKSNPRAPLPMQFKPLPDDFYYSEHKE